MRLQIKHITPYSIDQWQLTADGERVLTLGSIDELRYLSNVVRLELCKCDYCDMNHDDLVEIEGMK